MQIDRSTRDFLLGLYELRDPAEASTWIVNGMAKLFHAENAIICRHDGTHRIQIPTNPSHDKINARSVIKFVKHNSAPPEHTPEKVNRNCRRYTLRHHAGKGCRPAGER
jgi:hypothetical protein